MLLYSDRFKVKGRFILSTLYIDFGLSRRGRYFCILFFCSHWFETIGLPELASASLGHNWEVRSEYRGVVVVEE